jgi:hypothetical protein
MSTVDNCLVCVHPSASAFVRLALKLFSSGGRAIYTVISRTNIPGKANNKVRFHLLNTPAIACEMGISPVQDNTVPTRAQQTIPGPYFKTYPEYRTHV